MYKPRSVRNDTEDIKLAKETDCQEWRSQWKRCAHL